MLSILAVILLLATVAMLAVHLTSHTLVQQWYGVRQSWASRWLTPMRVLRFEAAYWVLALVAWPLWRSATSRTIVAAFASVYLLGWRGNSGARSCAKRSRRNARLGR